MCMLKLVMIFIVLANIKEMGELGVFIVEVECGKSSISHICRVFKGLLGEFV